MNGLFGSNLSVDAPEVSCASPRMKFPPEDRADSDTKPEMLDGVELGISFSGGPSEEQERKLLETAG